MTLGKYEIYFHAKAAWKTCVLGVAADWDFSQWKRCAVWGITVGTLFFMVNMTVLDAKRLEASFNPGNRKNGKRSTNSVNAKKGK